MVMCVSHSFTPPDSGAAMRSVTACEEKKNTATVLFSLFQSEDFSLSSKPPDNEGCCRATACFFFFFFFFIRERIKGRMTQKRFPL